MKSEKTSAEAQADGPVTAKTDKKALGLIFLTVLIDLIGFGLIIPVLPTYAEQLKAAPFEVGMLVASYSLMQFLFMPFWGRLSDKVGRRPILLISLAASTIGYVIWAFSNSLPMLIVSRLVAGAGNANIAVAQAYVSDVTTPENRSRGMGMIGAAFGLGFVLGPALGGFLVGRGLQTIGFVAAAFSLFDLILTFFLLPEPQKRSNAATERFSVGGQSFLKTLSDKRLSTSFAIFFISTFAFANMETTLVMLTERQFHFTAAQNSMMFLFIGLVMVVVQGGMIHRLTKKYGEKLLIEAGTVLVAIGLLLTPASDNVWILALSLTLLAIGSGINNPSNQSILSKLSPSDRVGGILGVGQSLSTLGRIVGPAVGGATFQFAGMSSPYVIGAVAMVVAFVLSLKLPDVNSSK